MAVYIRGFAETRANFRRLPAGVGRGIDTVCLTGLEPMRLETQRNAMRLRQPGRTPRGGHLDEGIVVRKVAGAGSMKRTFWISFTRRARKIAHLVEFGTRSHGIEPKRKKLLHFFWRGEEVYFSKVAHPGGTRRLFATTAFEATKSEVVFRVARGTWSLISSTLVARRR